MAINRHLLLKEPERIYYSVTKINERPFDIITTKVKKISSDAKGHWVFIRIFGNIIKVRINEFIQDSFLTKEEAIEYFNDNSNVKYQERS